MNKYRAILSVSLFLFSAICILLLTKTDSSAGLETVVDAIPDDPDEPISFIGHGAMFDSQGNVLDPSPEYLQEAQAYYLNQLSHRATAAQQAELLEKEAALSARTDLNMRDQMIVKSALIDWLLEGIEIDDAGALQGKNNFIKGAIRDLYPSTGDYPMNQDADLSAFLNTLDLQRSGKSSAVEELDSSAYLDECTTAGVPRPPDWGSSDWKAMPQLASNLLFLQLEDDVRNHYPNARAYYFADNDGPTTGLCMALPRTDKDNKYVGLLGIVCMGRETSNACFWDNQDQKGVNQPFPISEGKKITTFAGGGQLKGGNGGICTDCHAGENSFIFHPGTFDDPLKPDRLYPRDHISLILPLNFYKPLVDKDWPQNAGPSNSLNDGPCMDCHGAGRFPTISKSKNLEGYCSVVLQNAIYLPRQTMPSQGGDLAGYEDHIRKILAECPEPLGPFSPHKEEPSSSIEVNVISHNEARFTVHIINRFEADANNADVSVTFEKMTLVPESIKLSKGSGARGPDGPKVSGNGFNWRGSFGKKSEITIEYTARFNNNVPDGGSGSSTVSINDGLAVVPLKTDATRPGAPAPPTITPTTTATPTSVPPPPSGNRGFLPALEILPGSGWWAGIQAQNGGSAAAPIKLTAFEANGHSMACGAVQTSPGQSANFLSLRDCTPPHPSLGSGVLHANGQPLSSIVMINNINSQGTGFAGAAYKGMSEDAAAKTIFFPLVKHKHNGRTTVFSVQNASDAANNITAVFKVNGSQYTKSYNNIAPFASVLITPADAAVPGGFGQVGSLTVTGSQPMAGSSLEYEEDVPIAENLQASTAFTPDNFDKTLFCPLVRNGHTARGLTSGVQVQNVSSSAQTVQFIYSPVGGGAKIVRSRSINPGASATFYAPTEGIPYGSLGAVTVKGSGDIVAVVNERGDLPNGRIMQTTYACFGLESTSNEILIPLYKEFYLGNTTGIQVQNVSGNGHVATIELEYQVAGGPNGRSGQATFSHKTLVADGASITFWGVSSLPPGSDIFVTSGNPASLQGTYGSVVVKSDQPVVAIYNESSFGPTGVASNQDSKNYEGFNVGKREAPPTPTATPTATPEMPKSWQELGSSSASGGGISNNAGDSFYPAMTTDELGQPYMVWADSSSGNDEIYLKYWDNGVKQWRELGGSASGGGISNTGGSSIRPDITLHNGSVYVAWEDDSSGNQQIYVKQWDGSAWKGLGPTSGGGASGSGNKARFPSIEVLSGTPYLTYRNRNTSGEEFNIYVKKFDKTQNKWVEFGGSASGGGISNTNADSRKGSIVQVPNSDIYVSWHDKADGDYDVYVKKWDGSSWSGAVNVSNNVGDSLYSMMVADSTGQLTISWDDISSGNQEIYVKTFSGGQWQQLGGSGSGGGISNSSGVSLRATIALSSTNLPRVAWTDDSSGNFEIYVRQWDGSGWKEMGSGSASGGGISKNISSSDRPYIAVGSNDVPYVVWTDGAVGSRQIYFKVFE